MSYCRYAIPHVQRYSISQHNVSTHDNNCPRIYRSNFDKPWVITGHPLHEGREISEETAATAEVVSQTRQMTWNNARERAAFDISCDDWPGYVACCKARGAQATWTHSFCVETNISQYCKHGEHNNGDTCTDVHRWKKNYAFEKNVMVFAKTCTH